MSESKENPGLFSSMLSSCMSTLSSANNATSNTPDGFSTSSSSDDEDDTRRTPAGVIVAAPPPPMYVAAAPPVVAAPPMVMAAPPVVAAPPPMVMAAPPVVAQPPMMRPPAVWVQPMPAIPGCPPGLEYLTTCDQLIVEQLVEMMEVFTGIETANRYIIKNMMGQQVYYAMEMSSQSSRTYGGRFRAFVMRITDNNMQEVARVNRPEEPCCEHSKAHIEAPIGVTCGYVQGTDGGFVVFDANFAPFCNFNAPPDFAVRGSGQCTFPITTGTGQQVGMLVKHYGGALKEALTNADTFSIHWPLDMPANMKAVLLFTVFMVDFRYFEDKHPSTDPNGF